MSWTVDKERLLAVESERGEHAGELAALAALSAKIHALRDEAREKLAAGNLRAHLRRAVSHRLPALEYALARAQKRRRELGVAAPPSWERP